MVRVRVPFKVGVRGRAATWLLVTPAGLLIVRLLKVERLAPAMVCGAEPLKVTVLLPPVNVPLLVQLPATFNPILPAAVASVVPEAMIRSPPRVAVAVSVFVPLPVICRLL